MVVISTIKYMIKIFFKEKIYIINIYNSKVITMLKIHGSLYSFHNLEIVQLIIIFNKEMDT